MMVKEREIEGEVSERIGELSVLVAGTRQEAQ
jgi:hypothetical protein